ncbi:MAG: SusC/RagA family TonB-linked outer membrane protein [Bacteroidetes bacterium GWF2_40_14]|nr:MAG: SusC/RagA family TonB-linked outer membrane protein [Bacteroidetes bacterium GWF2_40_14]
MKKLFVLRHPLLLPLLCFFLLSGKLSGATQQERITLNLKDATITQFFKEIENRTAYKFFYKDSQVENAPLINVDANNKTLTEVLNVVFEKTSLSYEITGNQIVIKQKVVADKRFRTISGTVTDKNKDPLPFVTVAVVGTNKGVYTDIKGEFTIDVPVETTSSLNFRMIGMNDVTVILDKRTNYPVMLTENTLSLDEVVVTGIVNKRAESFTGSVTSISSKDLMRTGNKNVFESLKNLDPSLYIMDNITNGSNPNALPSMELRGTSSFPSDASTSISLKGNYGNVPNTPLFILDGFETTIERVMDMDMNRVESVTILKDASAKALYGSKAANGVVVIETKKLSGSEQRVTYTGSIDISMPDLTSYNLTNSAEKLEVERIEGVYSSPNFIEVQLALNKLYNDRKKLIEEGLDTYWLSKPLRVGIGSKHNVNIELGDSKSLKGIADFTYNTITGVMKGSDRKNISGNVEMSYRYKNILFRNIMTAVSNNSQESPWGDFGVYARMNPYWRSNDPVTGMLLRWAEPTTYTANPMFDATIGTTNTSSYLDFQNNFYVELRPTQFIKVAGRFGVSAKRSNADEFLPSNHSKYSTYTYMLSEELKMRRGSYRLDNGKSSSFSGDVNVSYSRTIEKHFISAYIGALSSESTYSAYVNYAEGFPNNQTADITFARQYAEGTRPMGLSSLNRELSFLSTVNYSYDNKYLVDATYRLGASSLYGKDNRWSTDWSVGLGWNLHNEGFLKNSTVIKQFKIRGSVGVTGNQNFNTSYAVGTYKYYTNYNYNGFTGAYLANMPNPLLRWEQRQDYNIGIDAEISKLKLKLDYYDGYTKNMLTDVSVAPSVGFNMVKDNLGLVRNKGFEITANINLWQNKNGFFNIYGSVASNTNEIMKLSESMKTYNALQEKEAADKGNNKPVIMYQDGMSMNAIWAVKSLGIDPMNGQEIYVKKDGTRTYVYDPLDLIVVGDTRPKARGLFGFTAEYKGFGFSTTFRYKVGGQIYNQTLVDRVENIDINNNVDKRVLTGRWQYPGQLAMYKRLGTFQYEGDPLARQEMTRATSRFVQDLNELTWGTASVYYDFPRSVIENWRIQRMRFSLYMNDVVTISSVQAERGLNYPFARTVSCSLSITF